MLIHVQSVVSEENESHPFLVWEGGWWTTKFPRNAVRSKDRIPKMLIVPSFRIDVYVDPIGPQGKLCWVNAIHSVRQLH